MVGEGTPEEIAATAGSYTGEFLKEILAQPAAIRPAPDHGAAQSDSTGQGPAAKKTAAVTKDAAPKKASAAKASAAKAPAVKKPAKSAESSGKATTSPDAQKAKRLARKAAALR